MFTAAWSASTTTKTTKISPRDAPSAKLITPMSRLQRLNSALAKVAAP